MASKLKNLLEQIHYRSLWQITLAYAAGCYALLGGLDTLGSLVGLPEWVSKAVFVLCLAALPLILATAYIQKRGIGGPELVTGAPEQGLRRWFSWRNVLLGAAVTFVCLATGAGGYMGMRVMGIGPMGTLQAKGLIPDTARVLVAQFRSPQEDPGLGRVLSLALTADLGTSDAIRVVHPEELESTLRIMGVPPGAAMTDSLAKITAVRSGIPVVVVGELARVGEGYHIDVRLLDPEDGTVFLHDDEQAPSAQELLGTGDHPGALDRLSGRLRERIGEDLKSLANRPPLPSVTTSSLEALRLFSEGLDSARSGNGEAWVTFLREAVDLDSTFAMAWRHLGMSKEVIGDSAAEAAMTRAYELRDRLSDVERLDVIGTYFLTWNMDFQRSAEAYQRLVARYPEHRTGWTNLSQDWYLLGEYEKYRETAQKAASFPNPRYSQVVNLWEAGLILWDTATAWEALTLAREGSIDVALIPWREGVTAVMAGDRTRARGHFEAGLEWARSQGDTWWESYYLATLGRLDAVEGRRASMGEQWARSWPLVADQPDPYPEWDRAMLAMYDFEIMGDAEAPSRVRDALRDLVSRLPTGSEPDLDLALFHAFYREPERARDILAKWEAQVPSGRWPDPWSRSRRLEVRGYIALAEEEVGDGLDFLHQAVEAGTTRAFPAVRLAQAYERTGMPDSALTAWQRYVDGPYFVDRFDSETFYLPLAYERLGQLYEERGETEEAAKYYELFVDLWADADPELQPRVKAAREALKRIESEN